MKAGLHEMAQAMGWGPDRCSVTGETFRYPTMAFMREIWEECDEHDAPTGKFITVEPCLHSESGGVIERHERLYIERYRSDGAICPGAMHQCIACKHRKGLVCEHPARETAQGLAFKQEPVGKERSGIQWSPNELNLSEVPLDWPTCLSRIGVSKSPGSDAPTSEPEAPRPS